VWGYGLASVTGNVIHWRAPPTEQRTYRVSLKRVSLPPYNVSAYKRGSVGKKEMLSVTRTWISRFRRITSPWHIQQRKPTFLLFNDRNTEIQQHIPAYTTDRSSASSNIRLSYSWGAARTDGNSHLWIEQGASYFSSSNKCTGTQTWRQRGWGTFSAVSDRKEKFQIRKPPPQEYFNIIYMLLSTHSFQKVHNRSLACYKHVRYL
jgi:hypothetical protein